MGPHSGMKYKLNATDIEWTIESVGDDAWLLVRKSVGDLRAVGTFRTPNEAAVAAGAEMTANKRVGERYLRRLRYVLSGWDVVEHSSQAVFALER